MAEQGLFMREGTIVDATIVAAASSDTIVDATIVAAAPSTKNKARQGDPEMIQAS
ncbi:hypothetical protein FHR97_002836 [Halomonas stenophila]|uniref:Uncharacterized protein n=1 Tax=Halomonas stenophila TaxID=795312 RepID=A0A7W5HM72_9GAMM|nr:hypothetical protein [Halomonas stenophila]